MKTILIILGAQTGEYAKGEFKEKPEMQMKECFERSEITKDNHERQSHMFQEIKSDVKNNLIKLNEKKKGQIVLGFVIDYDDLVKSISNDSIAQYRKIAENETKKDKWDKVNVEIDEFGPAV